MSKKHSMSALGAALLAGLTLATAIAPAANAAPTPAKTVVGKSVTQKLVFADATPNYFWAVQSSGSSQFKAERFLGLDGATLAASSWTMPGRGETGRISNGGFCLDAAPNNLSLVNKACDSGLGQIWHWEGTKLVNAENASIRYYAGGPLNGWRGVPASEGFDVANAPELTAPTASGSFDADVTKNAVLTGTGTPNATINVKETGGKVVASGKADGNGEYTLSIPAINFGGDLYTVYVTQTAAGLESPATKVDYHYGPGIVISTPTKDANLDEGRVHMTGTGVSGGRVVISVDGGGTAIGTATVATDGTWSLDTTSLAAGNHALEATQTGRGNNVTKTGISVTLAARPVAPSAPTAAGSFDADITKDAILTGTGTPNATISVKETGGKVVASGKADANGDYTISIPAINFGGDLYTVYVTQTAAGLESPATKVDYHYGPGIVISTPTKDANLASGRVSMTGTGTPGGRVTVLDGDTSVGSTDVDASGRWSLTTDSLRDGNHTLTANQHSKGNNKTSSTVAFTIDTPAAIANPVVVSPPSGSTVTTSRPTFTGTGQPGARITIGYGANGTIATGVIGTDGRFSVPATSGLALGVSNLRVTQTSGSDVKTIDYSLNRVAATVPFTVTSHANNATYFDGVATFRGTGAEGATVVAKNQWGTVMGTATIKDGQWSFNRNLGPTTSGYDITFTQTLNGQSSVVNVHLNYAGVLGLTVTAPINNSTYSEGLTTFTGRAMPGTTIVAKNQWNTVMGRATADLAGDWSFTRNLGPTTAGYDITFVATKGTDTQTTQIHLKNPISNVPVQVTSIRDGATYRPGLNILSGTGTPGATVNAVNATSGWNVPMGTTIVKADGTWALPERNWGPSNDYQIQVTQTNPDKTTSATTVSIKAPVFEALNVTGYTLGAANGAGVYATFTGTSTAYATVTIRSGASSSVYQTVEADENGNWTARRTWDPSHTYKLIFDQEALDGQTDTVDYGTFTAK